MYSKNSVSWSQTWTHRHFTIYPSPFANAAAAAATTTTTITSLQHCGSCTGYLCGNVSSTSWRVSPSVHCRAWRRITSPATVSWLPIPDRDPCGPPSDVSALCHVRTALSAIDPSRLPVRVHGTSCRSVYVTLGYCWLLSMHTWRHTYSPQCLRPRRICDFFAPHINVLTYLPPLPQQQLEWFNCLLPLQ